MPDESLKKRTREEELSQEPVIQTPESIQREADLRRSLLAARRTTGFAVTVKEGPRSAVVQPSSSAIEEIEISSESGSSMSFCFLLFSFFLLKHIVFLRLFIVSV